MVLLYLKWIAFLISVLVLNHGVNRLLVRLVGPLPALPQFAWGWLGYFTIFALISPHYRPTEELQTIYQWMTWSLSILGVAYALWQWKTQRERWFKNFQRHRWEFLMVGAFTLSMAVVGPYLEFPADPIAHLQFIQGWELRPYAEMEYGFTYFLYHWLLPNEALIYGDRSALPLFCALFQGLMLWLWIRFTAHFSKYRWLPIFGGVAALSFFGNEIFSFFQYYVLADTFLSYMIFIETLLLMIFALAKERWVGLFLLFPLTWFCYQNHAQEALLIVTQGLGAFLALLLFQRKQWTPFFRHSLMAIMISGVAGLLYLAFFRIPLPSEHDQQLNETILTAGHQIGSWQTWYHPLERVHQLLGFTGWLTMGLTLGLLLYSKRPRSNYQLPKPHFLLMALCLWPLFILLNPFTVEVWLRITHYGAGVLYRLLYASLYWVVLVVVLERIYDLRYRCIAWCNWKFSLKLDATHWWLQKALPASVGLLLLGIACTPQFPFYGRLPHLWTSTDPLEEGADLLPIINYLHENAPKHCPQPKPPYPILSDSYISEHLFATGYFSTYTGRWRDSYQKTFPYGLKTPPSGTSSSQPIPCYLVLYPRKMNPSWIAYQTKHWPADYNQQQRTYPPELIQWLDNHPEQVQLVFKEGDIRVYWLLDDTSLIPSSG